MTPPGRRWLRVLLFATVFASGGVAGGAAGAWAMRERMLAVLRHPEQVPDRVLPGLRGRLGLTDAQAAEVEAIVRRRHAAMEAARAEAYPDQLAEFRAMREEVAAVLAGGQREAWFGLCDGVEARYLPPAPARGGGPPPADLLFRKFDADRDGALTADEVPPPVWRRLQAADADADGKVTRDEYRAAGGR